MLHRLWKTALLLCLSVIAGCGITRSAGPPVRFPAEPNARVGSAKSDSGSRLEELQQLADEGTVNFQINADPCFESGQAEGNLLVANLEGSCNRLTVELVLKDTGESLYRSGAIAPGQRIDGIRLNRTLPAGDYSCIAYFNAYRLQEDTYLGRAGAEVTLHIIT
jgi:hypothetical protein